MSAGTLPPGDASPGSSPATFEALPLLLKPLEVADLLRTTKAAIYAMKERGQLPGVVHVGRRRWLVSRPELLKWLREKRAPAPTGVGP